MLTQDAGKIAEYFQLVTCIGGGAGDQDMVNDFVIHLNRLGEGNKKSTKTAVLFAPAMWDGETINNQVFTFAFAGDDALCFIGGNMVLRH